MNKVLITGSNGFIGRRLKTFLDKLGYDVFEYNADVKKPIDFDGDIEAIVHLAAKTFSQESIKNPLGTFEVNFLGTLNVLEFAKRIGAKVIFPSTSGVYKQSKTPVNEDSELIAVNPYVESKLLAEELCEFYSRVYSLKCIVLRIFNVYGAPEKDWALMQTIMTGLMNKKKAELSSPDNVRDYVYLEDVMTAFEAAIKYHSKNNLEIFNIGSGIGYSVGQVVDILSEAFGAKVDVQYTNFRSGELNFIIADISKTKKLLKWEPKVSIYDGARKMVQGFKKV